MNTTSKSQQSDVRTADAQGMAQLILKSHAQGRRRKAMTDHHPECEDATGAYFGSCSCAAIKRREALDDLFASDADLIDVETEATQEGGWKEAGRPWLWTYDPHLKETEQ
jgi:hypothetical protein